MGIPRNNRNNRLSILGGPSCGKKVTLLASNPSAVRFKDISGQRFGRLVALRRIGPAPAGSYWECQCDCGKKKIVANGALRAGYTKSCGCYRRESSGDKFRIHGMTGTGAWKHWRNMKRRCEDKNHPDYPRYGGRGIKVCKRWQSFLKFRADMGERPAGKTLERRNTNGNYSPSNCKWATYQEQANNRRTNIIIKFRGTSKTRAQWARTIGIGPCVLKNRLDVLHWPLKRALTTPLLSKRKLTPKEAEEIHRRRNNGESLRFLGRFDRQYGAPLGRSRV